MKISHTPWGQVQYQKEIAEGIVAVGTSSHGGFVLSAERLAAMPDKFKLNTYGTGRFFEEDCEWSLVVLAFPDAFGEKDRYNAKVVAKAMYPTLGL